MLCAVEEKYGKHRQGGERSRAASGEDIDDGNESSTDSEEEDDEGILASENLDAEISATLVAIRSKDPRVYDKKVTFYTEPGFEGSEEVDRGKEEKPMFLTDYHRKVLLEGDILLHEGSTTATTYTQQQDGLKNNIVKEMHAVAAEADRGIKDQGHGREDGGSDSDHDEFLVRAQKEAPGHEEPRKEKKALDVASADKDPETFLSNFMSARAWIPTAGSRFQAFESDDDEEESRAEAFEEAYNLRFEDPGVSNEKLLSHARDAAAKHSVRRETTNTRKKARNLERAKKEAEKRNREEEKARLRKLKIADAQEKIQKIKRAAGVKGEVLQAQDWANFLDEDWDDDRWNSEMVKRFGDQYYADHDVEESDGDKSIPKKKARKPRWHDDIDINDIIPDFNAEQEAAKPPFTLTDSESDAGVELSLDVHDGLHETTVPFDNESELKGKSKSSRKHQSGERTGAARKQRRLIEQIVDKQLETDMTLSNTKSKHAGAFRYRETSPLTYGLTSQDILMASDSQLNQYAGLKKMATFRDAEKKRKDKKRLGKKARLRQWRKETFGSEHGPQKSLAELLGSQAAGHQTGDISDGDEIVNVVQSKKRRKRPKKANYPSIEDLN